MIVGKDRFRITIKYRLIKTAEGDVSGITILPDDAQGDDVKVFVCEAVGRDADNWSNVLEAASIINRVTGKPFVRRRVLIKQIITTFIKNWNFADKSGPIPFTPDRVGSLHDSLQKEIAWRWIAMTGGVTPT